MPNPIKRYTTDDLQVATNSFLVMIRDQEKWRLTPENTTNIFLDWARCLFVNGKSAQASEKVMALMRKLDTTSFSRIPNNEAKTLFNEFVMSELYPETHTLLSSNPTTNIDKLNAFYVQDIMHLFNQCLRTTALANKWHVTSPNPVCNLQCDEKGNIYADVMISNFKLRHEDDPDLNKNPLFGNIHSRFYLRENGFELAWVGFSNSALAKLCIEDENKTTLNSQTFGQAYNEEMQQLRELFPSMQDKALRDAIINVFNTTHSIPPQNIPIYFGLTSYLKTMALDPSNKTTLVAFSRGIELLLAEELTPKNDPMLAALQKLEAVYRHHLANPLPPPTAAAARKQFGLFKREDKDRTPAQTVNDSDKPKSKPS